MEWETAWVAGVGPFRAGLCRSSQHQLDHRSHAVGKPLPIPASSHPHALLRSCCCTKLSHPCMSRYKEKSWGIVGIFGHSSIPRICFLTFEMAFPFERFGKLFEKKKHLETFLKGQNQNKHLENKESAHPVWNVHFLWICCAYFFFSRASTFLLFWSEKNVRSWQSLWGWRSLSHSALLCMHHSYEKWALGP